MTQVASIHQSGDYIYSKEFKRDSVSLWENYTSCARHWRDFANDPKLFEIAIKWSHLHNATREESPCTNCSTYASV